MQAQKFDPTKPHGMVYGHPEALYMQTNQLYGGDGLPLDDSGQETKPKQALKTVKAAKAISDEPEASKQASNAVEFLANLLEGGPVLQVNVKREAEGADIPWADMLSASAEMSIEKIRKGPLVQWKLPVQEDVAPVEGEE